MPICLLAFFCLNQHEARLLHMTRWELMDFALQYVLKFSRISCTQQNRQNPLPLFPSDSAELVAGRQGRGNVVVVLGD